MSTREDNEDALVNLLRRIAQRDERAYRELMLKFNIRIHAFLWDKLRNPADVEEVIADTGVAIWNTAHTFERRSSVARWVLGIADNRRLMKLRSGRKHENHVDIDDVAEELTAETLDPADLIAAKQHRHLFATCIGALNPDQRECLIMQMHVGLSDLEIAGTLKEPHGTIKSRLHHARKKLTRCIMHALKLIPPTE